MKFTIALLAGLLMMGTAFAQQKEQRVALVIGNNDYQYAKKLDNAVADAQAFRRELVARGFQVVYRENANRRTMNGAMDEFIGKLGTDAIGLVYYSGHGVQINGANYLVPTDLSAKTPSDFVNDAIDLERLVSRVSQAQAKFSLAVIDACRDNPFQGSGRDIGGSRGLVAPSGNASGMMVVYSAGANQKALDRLSDADRNPNGLFTREFLKAMRIPGLTVQEAVNKIKTSVIAQAKGVGHVQTPAIYDQSVGTFMFTPGEAPAPADNTVRPAPVVVVPAMTAEQREDAFWVDAKAAGNKEAFEGYLEIYPKGRYSSLARANIARLTASASALDKVATENAAKEKAAAEKVMADKAVADRVAADKATADRVAADKATTDRVAAEKATADKAVADRVAADKPKCYGPEKATWTNCVGQVTTPKGQKYIGEFRNGKQTGKGAYIYPHGLKYEGEFINGQYNGQGTLTQPDGAKYVGKFLNSKENGEGIEYGADGAVLRSGFWKDGVFVKGMTNLTPLLPKQ